MPSKKRRGLLDLTTSQAASVLLFGGLCFCLGTLLGTGRARPRDPFGGGPHTMQNGTNDRRFVSRASLQNRSTGLSAGFKPPVSPPQGGRSGGPSHTHTTRKVGAVNPLSQVFQERAFNATGNLGVVFREQDRAFDPTKNFSVIHVSKSAGSSLIRVMKDLNVTVYPTLEAGKEHSVWYQKNQAAKDADYHLISMRSPRHHTWSLFTECKYSAFGRKNTKGTNFPRSNPKQKGLPIRCDKCDEDDFHVWISSFLPIGSNATGTVAGDRFSDPPAYAYNCYHPANYQSRAFTSHQGNPHGVKEGDRFEPDLHLALDTYKTLDFVGLVEFFHESRCLLYHKLGPAAPLKARSYIDEACGRCGLGHDASKKANDVHVNKRSLGQRKSILSVNQRSLEKVDVLTKTDAELYVNALWVFMSEIVSLESTLGRRVMCNEQVGTRTGISWRPQRDRSLLHRCKKCGGVNMAPAPADEILWDHYVWWGFQLMSTLGSIRKINGVQLDFHHRGEPNKTKLL